MDRRITRSVFRARTISLAIAATCMASSTAAQEALILEEVLVVAQKREQRLQDVPVAVSAISGNVIEQLGMDRMEDLEQLSPSLSVSSGSKNTNGGFSIRGIGTNGVFGIQTEPAVLVVFDDVS
jgi:iron complex outermembrane receptor protein